MDDLIVRMVLVGHKVPIVPLKIVSEDIDGTRVLLGECVEPLEKVSHTMFSSETDGARIVFGFGHEEIGHMLFLELHGFNVKEHVQGGWILIVVAALVITPLVGPQGLKASGSTPFGRTTPLLLLFAFAFLFLFFLFLRRGGFLNETLVGLRVDVLFAGGTGQVAAPMTFDLWESRFHLETPRASAFVETDTALKVLGGFSFQGFA